MTDDRETPFNDDPAGPIPFPRWRRGGGGGEHRPRLKKLRLALLLCGLSALALVSTVFGMMMAVASDLPRLENRQEFRNARNSVLLDVRGRPLGILTGNRNVVLVGRNDIAPVMKHAIIAVEDRRFYTNQGVDLRGIGRALYSDVSSEKPVQGASTITQQFVKNALAAQSNRTVFEKLREAALAYHLSRKWSKEKILTEYLNTIYFGNGAYGIESAARTYFSKNQHPGCGTSRKDPSCAGDLSSAEAAFLAGVVSSPSAYDPIAHPRAARARRDLVLHDMLAQHYIGRSEYRQDLMQALPSQSDITPPQEKSQAPYFTSWVRQQVVDRFGPERAFNGGLKIRTSIDLDLQKAAEQAIAGQLPPGSGLPTASLVAIDNRTGQVRAMVGGSDYDKSPFNLATQGQRQPGSAIKPFTLAVALQQGISPDSIWASRRKVFTVPHTGGVEHFVVNNFESAYAGTHTLADAMTVSDNSVYAEVGIRVGTRNVARMAERMGIRTPVSDNYAMTLGGLKQGVTPLDMAHAYETFATGGRLVTSANGLGASKHGPVGIDEVRSHNGKLLARDRPLYTRVLPSSTATEVQSILETVVQSGTGTAAQIPGLAAGKTGTTENYGDAWFVGWNEHYTVAVWVGYPNRLRPMRTLYHGGPVEGGTYPAQIWHDFMTQAQTILDSRHVPGASNSAPSTSAPAPTDTGPAAPSSGSGPSSSPPPSSSQPAPSTPAPSQQAPPSGGGGGGGNGGGGNATPAPAPTPPAPAPTPGGGGGGGGGGGSGGAGTGKR